MRASSPNNDYQADQRPPMRQDLTPLRGCPRPEKMGCCRDDMPVKVKICGITNLSDGMAAAEAGADALGFVLAPSKRRVTLTQVAAMVDGLPPFVARRHACGTT